MSRKNIPNVLPDGFLKPISYNDFVIAKLNNDAKPNTEGLNDKISKKTDKEV